MSRTIDTYTHQPIASMPSIRISLVQAAQPQCVFVRALLNPSYIQCTCIKPVGRSKSRSDRESEVLKVTPLPHALLREFGGGIPVDREECHNICYCYPANNRHLIYAAHPNSRALTQSKIIKIAKQIANHAQNANMQCNNHPLLCKLFVQQHSHVLCVQADFLSLFSWRPNRSSMRSRRFWRALR